MTTRMYYGQYKKHYSDCATVPGSYQANTKTIEVVIPEGRMKDSGVRGKHFRGYQLWLVTGEGKTCYTTYRAVSLENAMKQHTKYCKEMGWTPCDPPKGEVARIYC